MPWYSPRVTPPLMRHPRTTSGYNWALLWTLRQVEGRPLESLRTKTAGSPPPHWQAGGRGQFGSTPPGLQCPWPSGAKGGVPSTGTVLSTDKPVLLPGLWYPRGWKGAGQCDRGPHTLHPLPGAGDCLQLC
ncbi:uncharacterized protein LOC135097022 isoform X3 [Scylla paramamosain]|uniref:uncharacterized protein LOC135097022 isoform X3 n=1 Tax=Scylla paramamosain TaxID=85552 RepID=UPI003083C093